MGELGIGHWVLLWKSTPLVERFSETHIRELISMLIHLSI